MDLRWQPRDKSDEGLPSSSQNWVVLLEDGRLLDEFQPLCWAWPGWDLVDLSDPPYPVRLLRSLKWPSGIDSVVMPLRWAELWRYWWCLAEQGDPNACYLPFDAGSSRFALDSSSHFGFEVVCWPGLWSVKEFLPPLDPFLLVPLCLWGGIRAPPPTVCSYWSCRPVHGGRTSYIFCTSLASRNIKFFVPQCRWALLLPP